MASEVPARQPRGKKYLGSRRGCSSLTSAHQRLGTSVPRGLGGVTQGGTGCCNEVWCCANWKEEAGGVLGKEPPPLLPFPNDARKRFFSRRKQHLQVGMLHLADSWLLQQRVLQPPSSSGLQSCAPAAVPSDPGTNPAIGCASAASILLSFLPGKSRQVWLVGQLACEQQLVVIPCSFACPNKCPLRAEQLSQGTANSAGSGRKGTEPPPRHAAPTTTPSTRRTSSWQSPLLIDKTAPHLGKEPAGSWRKEKKKNHNKKHKHWAVICVCNSAASPACTFPASCLWNKDDESAQGRLLKGTCGPAAAPCRGERHSPVPAPQSPTDTGTRCCVVVALNCGGVSP